MIRQVLHLAALAFVPVLLNVFPLAAQTELDASLDPPPGVEVGDIIDFACFELRRPSGSGCRDRAFLVASDDRSYAGLLIVTNELPEGDAYTYYPDIVLIGSRPRLDLSEEEAVSLHGMWPGAGRYRWAIELTLKWNGTGLSVSDYVLGKWDGITGVQMTCSLDISEGTYRVEHELIALESLTSHYAETGFEPPPDLIWLSEQPRISEGQLQEPLSDPRDWSYPRHEPWPCNEAEADYYEQNRSVERILEDMRLP